MKSTNRLCSQNTVFCNYKASAGYRDPEDPTSALPLPRLSADVTDDVRTCMAFLLRALDVLASNIGQETGYPDYIFLSPFRKTML
jgi:hypothetical protein